MDDSFNIARHVARFTSLLMRQPNDVPEQKLELRTLALLTAEGTVRLTTRKGQLVANGLAVPQVLVGVRDLAEQMDGHAIESIEIHQAMAPGELLALGRIIAEPLTVDRETIHERIRAAAATTITIQLGEQPAPAHDAAPAIPMEPEPAAGSPERIPFVLRRAARGGDGQPLVPLFEEVAFAVEQATREGRTADAVATFRQIIEHENTATDFEVRRQFLLVVRRLVKPHVLAPIARMVGDDPGSVADALAVLARCGTDGSDAVIDQIGRAPSAAERNRFVGALNELTTTDASLVTMLGDARPHVARLAATLIAERRPPDGDKALADRLASDDHRVRRAAVRALGAYATPFSLDAIARALTDPVVEVRLEAVSALGGVKAPRAADILSRAMDAEDDVEVQIGMLGALGRLATGEAVATLAKVADPGGGLFGGRKDTAVRVAAVRALAEVRSGAALNALRGLTGDKEREVRDTANRAVAR